jgi:hypothetical protein
VRPCWVTEKSRFDLKCSKKPLQDEIYVFKICKKREESVTQVIVVYIRGIVLEVRPAGLPDELRAGGAARKIRNREELTKIIPLIGLSQMGVQCHETKRSRWEDERAIIT